MNHRSELDKETRIDEATIEQWFDQFSSELHRYVMRHLGDLNESDDLVQEVFVVALKKVSTYREQGNARAYLYRIAKNIILASRRRRKTIASVPFNPETMGHQEELIQDSQPANEAKELPGEVKAKLLTLECIERMVVHLRIEKNLKFKEIAKTLELPLNTTISKFHRAIIKLRNQRK